MRLSAYQRAVHEAGHAVVAISLGFVCESASIRPIGNSGGRTVVISAVRRNGRRIWPQQSDGMRLANVAMHTMAGAAAEKEIVGYSSRGDIRDRYENQQLMRDLLELLPAAEDVLYRATRDLVRQHRPTIERVAEILEKHKDLSGAYIDALVGLPREQQDLHALVRTWEQREAVRNFPGEAPCQLLLPL